MALAKDGRQALVEPYELWIGRFALPAGEMGRLEMTKLKRARHRIEQHRHQTIARSRIGRLVQYPFGLDRFVGPYDDHGRRCGQCLLNHLVKALTVVNVAVPPHLQSLGFESMHERCDARTICTS